MAVCHELERQGLTWISAPAPRLTTTASNPADLAHQADEASRSVLQALSPVRGLNIVINAAGLSSPGARLDKYLLGANALLPAALAMSAEPLGITRIVHVGSAAVYGTGRLNERYNPVPETAYGISKLLGDTAMTTLGGTKLQTIIYRPTSVHGIQRSLTRQLIKFANSPFASVAGSGGANTPQVLVENVAQAIVYLALSENTPTGPILHPSEGMTTGALLRGLSRQDPKHIPTPLAKLLCRTVQTVPRRFSSSLQANARRLEMLWFGQPQDDGWLSRSGFRARRTWEELFNEIERRATE